MTPSPLQTLTLATRSREEWIRVDGELQRILEESGIREGLVLAQVQHTTAGLTVNENADPDVGADFFAHLRRMVPQSGGFLHSEGNSDAHIKASLAGASVSLLVSQGRICLGTWQGVYFCEFDGPRTRKILVRVLGE